MDELTLIAAEAAAADRAIEENNAALLAANDPAMQDAGPVVDDEKELRGLVELAAVMLKPVLPGTAEAAKLQAPEMAAAGAEVMRLHGWTLGGLTLKYAPYIALVVAVLPVVTTARAEIAAQKAAQQKQAANDGEYQQKSAG